MQRSPAAIDGCSTTNATQRRAGSEREGNGWRWEIRGELPEHCGDLFHFLSNLLTASGRNAARLHCTHVFLVDEKGRKKVFISVLFA